MKTSRKGFTLVELLIVVAILATLTASMTYSINGATAKAKAAVIASNVEAMKGAASLCVATNGEKLATTDRDLSTVTTAKVMAAYLPTWADFSQADPSGTDAEKLPIKYVAGTETGGPDKWTVTINFTDDPEKVEIIKALKKIKGYGAYYNDSGAATAITDTTYSLKITLITGKIEPST